MFGFNTNKDKKPEKVDPNNPKGLKGISKQKVIFICSAMAALCIVVLGFVFIPKSCAPAKYKMDITCSHCTVEQKYEFHSEYNKNESLYFTFRADLGYALPNDVTVIAGNKRLYKGQDYQYNYENGLLTYRINEDTMVSVTAQQL